MRRTVEQTMSFKNGRGLVTEIARSDSPFDTTSELCPSASLLVSTARVRYRCHVYNRKTKLKAFPRPFAYPGLPMSRCLEISTLSRPRTRPRTKLTAFPDLSHARDCQCRAAWKSTLEIQREINISLCQRCHTQPKHMRFCALVSRGAPAGSPSLPECKTCSCFCHCFLLRFFTLLCCCLHCLCYVHIECSARWCCIPSAEARLL